MIEHIVQSHDGIDLKYATSEIKPSNPWVAVIIPFGMKVEMVCHIFDFFQPHYNLVAWEARSILESSDRLVSENEFSIENHILDLHKVLSQIDTKKFIMLGYCSGAGLALAAANRYPNMIDCLILAHGEYTLLNEPELTTQFSMEIDSLLSLAGKDEEHLQLVFKKISNERIEDNSNRPDGVDLPFTKQAYLRRHSANYLSYKDVDFEHLARFVTHKTFVMSGERDVQANAASSQRIHELIANSEIYVDPDADHYGILRQDSNTMVTIWNYLYDHRMRSAA